MNAQARDQKPSIISGAIWSVLDNTVSQVITFIIFIILAKLLTPSIYGMLSVSLLVTQFFRNVIFDSIATSIVRMKSPTPVDYNSAFFLCFSLSVPAFLIVFLFAPVIETYMKVPELANVIRGTGIIIVVSGLSRTHEAWLTHNMMFRPLAIRSICSISIGGAVGVVLACKGYAVTSLVVQQVVTSLISLIVLWMTTPWKPKMKISKDSIRESVGFSKHVALSNITNFANQNSDVFFITYFLGTAGAGVYSAGKRIVNTLNTVLSSALMRVSLPAFTRYKNDLNEFGKKYLQATYFTVLVTAPAFVGLSALSHDITFLLLGQKWMPSVPIMQIVSAVGFVTSIGYYNHSVMFARDKPEWQARLTLLYAISNVLAFYIFVRYGLIATALVFSIRTILLYPVSAWCALTLLDLTFRQYIREIIVPIICAGGMCMILMGMQEFTLLNESWAGIAVKISVGAISYFILIFTITSKSRKAMILSLAGKIFKRS